ncbi:dihydroceramide fatty acyl 2-hydroxylase FAH1-like [Actinidia eriantha]|uniref:dihydroceramide fatty acyl 2-hydroxylase FAH1-like n=1 Tax=Actinidia eriantha TaxID=165200 RepID=UPI002590C3A9|nr:dihydroceramide fatty acyl 2-hydroxylase FAH1-like [Actinidia eriantha]
MRNGFTSLLSARKDPGFLGVTSWSSLPALWLLIPVILLPVVYWFVSVAVQMGVPCPQIAASMIGGFFVWTLLEYSLHRFLFHIRTTSYWGYTIHYLLHGCHHKHPMDGLRLVFPPAGAVILVVPLWSMVKLVAPSSIAPALMGGGLLGYIMYDCTHYYVHHGKPAKGVSSSSKVKQNRYFFIFFILC